jgi:squalene-hopene/tetraprenyl-beta-curcumene cyclase
MKSTIPLIAAGLLAIAPSAIAQQYASIQEEIRQAIARGNAWLATQQHEDGYWGDERLPAFTALALSSAVLDPEFDAKKPFPENIEKAYKWLLTKQQEDGGIYDRGLSVYNTAVSINALAASGRKEFEPAIVRARAHLIGHQWDSSVNPDTDPINDGGIGYGSDNTHTDLSNTFLALEALALTEHIVGDGEYGDQPKLNWEAAIGFISRCQNLEETNDQPWASNDPANHGGFIYAPGQSKAGEQELEGGRIALRSYGSMSYAGLLSFIYAKLSPEDPRVAAVMEWLNKNYSLEENPGLGAQGLYYYYQTMAKALTAANVNTLTTPDGKAIDWRKELAGHVLKNQREDGSWVNDNGRWMESNPVLVTTYMVLALQQIDASIPN